MKAKGYTVPLRTRLEMLAMEIPTVKEAMNKMDEMRDVLEQVNKGPQPGQDLRKWIERRMKDARDTLEGTDAI